MKEMNYPNNIAMIRRMRGLAQAYVAKEIGISRPKYIDVEKGLKELTVSQVEKLKKLLDVEFEDLVGIDTGRLDFRKFIREQQIVRDEDLDDAILRGNKKAKEMIPPKFFEKHPVRSAWDEEKEEWYFSVVDAIGVLIEQPDYRAATKYWNKVKTRLAEEGNQLSSKCRQLRLTAKDGKKRLTDVATMEELFRII